MRLNEIIDYWFSYEDDPSMMAGYDRETTMPKKWIRQRINPSEETIERMRALFQQDLDNLNNGKYEEWQRHKDGRLALVILANCINRALNPGSEETYRHDVLASSLAKAVLESPIQRKSYKAVERLFIIFPLVQSEEISNLELALETITDEIEYAYKIGNKELEKKWNQLNEQAENVYSILKAFGRLPYRNAILNRESTAEEIEFMGDNSE